MPARTTAVDLAQPPLQPRQQVRVSPPSSQPRQVVGDRRQPVHTRSALPGALARQIVRDPGRLHEPARVRTEDDNDAHAGGRADGPERQRCVGSREVHRADPRAAVSANEEGLWRARRERPACDVDQRRATVDLYDSGSATRRPRCVTRVVPGSSTMPRLRKASAPVRTIMATCASVSALWTSADRRPIRSGVPLSGRNDGRDSTRVEEPRQCRLLAGDEAVRWSDECFGHSRVTDPDALVERPDHRLGDRMPPLRHTDRDGVRAACRRQHLGAVEHEVRRPEKEKLVLVAGGFTLHGVDDDGADGAAGASRRELGGSREACRRPGRRRPDASSVVATASRQRRSGADGSGTGPSVARCPARSAGCPSRR